MSRYDITHYTIVTRKKIFQNIKDWRIISSQWYTSYSPFNFNYFIILFLRTNVKVCFGCHQAFADKFKYRAHPANVVLRHEDKFFLFWLSYSSIYTNRNGYDKRYLTPVNFRAFNFRASNFRAPIKSILIFLAFAYKMYVKYIKVSKIPDCSPILVILNP